ncbi:MAG: hypothetical protein LUF82_05940 [Clostridia bacterium]|nr:hypothetical protein [Clostridia bacterium]
MEILTNKNLLAAKRFYQDCFGAVCFCNEPQDGYFKSDDGREIHTLAIYFPNRLDQEDEKLSTRLRNAAGKNFFESYDGAKGLRLCGINGCKIMACFLVNGKVVAIKRYGALGLKGSVEMVADYFCGYDLGACNNHVTADVTTNNGFKITKGMTFKQVADDFLSLNSIPEMNEKNGYFIFRNDENKSITPGGLVVSEIITRLFPENQVKNIAAKRQKEFEKLFDKLTTEEWHSYLTDMQIPVFDRIIDKK